MKITLVDVFRAMKDAGVSRVFIEPKTLKKLKDQAPPAPKSALPLAPKPESSEGSKQARWEALRQEVLSCPTFLAQVKPGKQIVFGVGNLDADLFFCGEAPGAEEELQGEPFVGPAGKLLTRIIEAMGLSRAQVYIGNIMNYRPPMPTPTGNRPPTTEEISACLPYLKGQLAIVRPKVVIALGATAAKGLLGPQGEAPMSRLRGQVFDFNGTPLVVTYHPSYLLHNPSLSAKRALWEDLLRVMEHLGMVVSEKQRGYFLV